MADGPTVPHSTLRGSLTNMTLKGTYVVAPEEFEEGSEIEMSWLNGDAQETPMCGTVVRVDRGRGEQEPRHRDRVSCRGSGPTTLKDGVHDDSLSPEGLTTSNRDSSSSHRNLPSTLLLFFNSNAPRRGRQTYCICRQAMRRSVLE